jgi:hypothetical protein
MATTKTFTGLHIRLQIQDAFDRKKSQRLSNMVLSLISLKQDLNGLSDLAPLDRIVKFFVLIAPWYDRLTEFWQMLELFEKVNYGQYNLLIFQIKALIKHLENAGRDICGYNRTDKGQEVTPSNVFLGGVEEIGVKTHTVAYWQNLADTTPGICNDLGYKTVCNIAKQFTDSHIPLLLYIISSLESL